MTLYRLADMVSNRCPLQREPSGTISVKLADHAILLFAVLILLLLAFLVALCNL